MQSREVYGLFSSDPTSILSGYPCNRFRVLASRTTFLALTQLLVCCIDGSTSRPLIDLAEVSTPFFEPSVDGVLVILASGLLGTVTGFSVRQ